MIGCGAVGKSVILYWDKIIPHVKYDKFTIIEPENLPPMITTGKFHLKTRLTPKNYNVILTLLSPDFVVDLSVNVGSTSIINWCFVNNTPYISTAIENWEDTPAWSTDKGMYENSLLIQQRSILQLNSYSGPTILVDHGMNPGMISHFTKIALEKMAKDKNITMETYPQISRDLKVQVIQCSEIDTQRVEYKPDSLTFVNTWSSVGFYEEGGDPTQIGWGSHELCANILGEKDMEQLFIRKRGMDCWAKGYNPLEGEYVGMCIPHSESATISRFLTMKDYRPSSYYVYKPAPCAIESLKNVRENDYEMLPYYHVVTCDEIIDGSDAVGALLMMENGENYWAGTIISKKDVPLEFQPYTNPTIVQVVCGVLSGIDYVLSHQNMGVIFPEEVDSHRVFELTKDYLGDVLFEYVDCDLPRSFVDLIV